MIITLHSKHILTSRLNVHYLEAGQGDPLLLIHGWPQTSHCWHKVMPELAKHFRVIAPDLRGFGLSEKSGLPLSRTQLAEDMIAFLDSLQLSTVNVAGHDWGGMIALKMALDFPERIKKLCLIDCSTTHWPHWAAHGLWAKVTGLAEDFFAQGYEQFIRWCFAGEPATYPIKVISPFPSQAVPGLDWCDDNSLQHYIANLSHSGTQAASVSLYRDALPFYRQDQIGQWQQMNEDTCKAIWQFEGGPFKHPEYRHALCFAPEDLGKQFSGSAMYIYTPMLLPRGFKDGLPIENYQPVGDPFSDSIVACFTNLCCKGIQSGHFIPEEQPDALAGELIDFFASA